MKYYNPNSNTRDYHNKTEYMYWCAEKMSYRYEQNPDIRTKIAQDKAIKKYLNQSDISNFKHISSSLLSALIVVYIKNNCKEEGLVSFIKSY